MEFEKTGAGGGGQSSSTSSSNPMASTISASGCSARTACISQVKGPSGQRLGCMGMPGTTILCEGSTSDDVGYLNIGAEITVLGDATNGACNAMANGKVYIGGSIGARGLTMTKWNPDYTRPELWVLGSTGDSFAEFNCGGIAVVCGVEPKESGQYPRLPPLCRNGRRSHLFPRPDRRLLPENQRPPRPAER